MDDSSQSVQEDPPHQATPTAVLLTPTADLALPAAGQGDHESSSPILPLETHINLDIVSGGSSDLTTPPVHHDEGSFQPSKDSTPPITISSPRLAIPSPPSQEKGTTVGPSSASVKQPTNEITATTPTPNAWSKPLTQSLPASAGTILMQTTKNLLSDLSKDSHWPSLLAANNAPSKRRQNASRANIAGHAAHANSDPTSGNISGPQVCGDSDPEYPWASKLEKSKRNLHKVTSPVFLEDGTPKVRIPRQVMLEGLENQKEFVFGQFYRCSAPASGLIQSVVNRIWGTRCQIFTRQVGNNSFLFHIPDEQTRKWVIQRGIWHVDDCIMFVSTWNSKGTFSVPEITTLPVWLTLKDIPHQLYSKKGISWIASGIGAPMLTSKPWLDPILMGEAKILVEVKLDRPFPRKVAIEDESGSISMVSVVYSWLPSVCPKCGQLGHKAPRCLGLPSIPVSTAQNTQQNEGATAEVASVPVTTTAPLQKILETSQDARPTNATPPIGHNDDHATPSILSPKESVLASGYDPSYVVIGTTQGLTQPTLSSSKKENSLTIKQLMIPVMGTPVASAFSTHVPLQQTDDAHASHSTTILETNDPTEGQASPTNNSLPKSSSPLPANTSPLSSSKDGHSTHNNLVDTPSTDFGSMDIVHSGIDSFDFGTHDTQEIVTQVGGTIDPENGSRSHGFPTTRGGRQIKPTQKFQETDWKTVTSRRGRRGGQHH